MEQIVTLGLRAFAVTLGVTLGLGVSMVIIAVLTQRYVARSRSKSTKWEDRYKA